MVFNLGALYTQLAAKVVSTITLGMIRPEVSHITEVISLPVIARAKLSFAASEYEARAIYL